MAPQSALPTWAALQAPSEDVLDRAEAPGQGSSADEHNSFDISSADLRLGELIGKGRFKEVYAGSFRQRAVVILRYKSAAAGEQSNELRILRRLRSSSGSAGGNAYVPEIHGTCVEAGSMQIVQERAQWGSLRSVLKEPENTLQLTPAHLVVCGIQLARAMVFLASNRVIHADLACRNLLVCRLEEPRDTVVKITDFGLALILDGHDDSVCLKQPQATRWCAPETVAQHKWSHRSDAWALGATLWELFSRGVTPWPRLDRRVDVAVRLKRLAGDRGVGAAPPAASGRGLEDLTADFPRPADCLIEDVHLMVLSCLRADEHRRPSFAAVAASLEGAARGAERCTSKAPSEAMSTQSVSPSTKTPGSTPCAVSPALSPSDTCGQLLPRLDLPKEADCRLCGTALCYRAKFCSECGEATKACCRVCGAELSVKAKFCSECGVAVALSASQPCAGGVAPSAAAAPLVSARFEYQIPLPRFDAEAPFSARHYHGSTSPRRVDAEAGSALAESSQRARALEEFVWSHQAIEAFGEDVVDALRMKTEAAAARELFLADAGERRLHMAWQSQERQCAARAAAERCLATPRSPRFIAPAAWSAWEAAGGVFESPPLLRPAALQAWALWSYANGQVLRHSFAHEAGAQAAFCAARAEGRPCSLRDPVGREVVAASLVCLPEVIQATLRGR